MKIALWQCPLYGALLMRLLTLINPFLESVSATEDVRYREVSLYFFSFLYWIWKTYVATLGLKKSWTGFILNSFVKKWAFLKTGFCCIICPKVGLFLRWFIFPHYWAASAHSEKWPFEQNWTQLENQLAKFDFVKRFWLLRASTIKRDILIKRLRNGISVKSNNKRLTEFTNCHLSQRLVELALFFFNDVEKHEFPSNCTKSYLRLGERSVLYSHLSFTVAYSLKSEKDWPADFAKLWSRESDSVYNHVS